MLLKNMKTGLIFKNPTKYFQGIINKKCKINKIKGLCHANGIHWYWRL